ncbi:MAG: SMI1/KNR4 family protein [Desulfobulbaceae bacterium]|nr:SMI1/KNR4 family protein [Desulfobulbaceae bacterium]
MDLISLFKNINLEVLRVFRTFLLLQPASDNEIFFLKREINSRLGQNLPVELENWFRWHNGQQECISLVKNENRYLLTINEALKAWQFFLDPSNEFLEPFEPFWFPIMTNGSSDYLVYVMDGSASGNLIEYWHDETCRDVRYNSLADWALFVLDHLRELPFHIEKYSSILEDELPQNLTIAVSCNQMGKNLKLYHEIKKITDESLIDIKQRLSEGFPSNVFVRDLSASINCLERSIDVRKVLKVAKVLQKYGVPPVLRIRKNNEGEKNSYGFETISLNDMEKLISKCL